MEENNPHKIEERIKLETKYKNALVNAFSEAIPLSKVDPERSVLQENIIKTLAKCPPKYRILSLLLACMLTPDVEYPQNLLAKEVAKPVEGNLDLSANDIEDMAETYLDPLPESKRKSEHQSKLYKEGFGNNGLAKKIEENKKEQLAFDFNDNMDGIHKAQNIHDYLSKTLKDADVYRNSDKMENKRRGQQKKIELDKDKIMPKVQKATAYVKVALLLDNTKCLQNAISISNQLDPDEKEIVNDTIRLMKEIGEARPSAKRSIKFVAQADNYLEKLGHNG